MLTCETFSRDLTVSIPPSASHHTFSFGIVHQSQTSNTTCTGTSEEGITCKDSAYKIEVDAAATSMSLFFFSFPRPTVAQIDDGKFYSFC